MIPHLRTSLVHNIRNNIIIHYYKETRPVLEYEGISYRESIQISTVKTRSVYLYQMQLPVLQHYCAIIIFFNRYHFKVSNAIGSVEDTINLIVRDEDGQIKQSQKLNLESHSVTQDEFGEYVASSHAHNNSTFVLQFQVWFACSY